MHIVLAIVNSISIDLYQVCSRAKFGKFWKSFSTNIGIFWHVNFGIDPKLAETAPLFYRATDVPFLPKMEQEPKLAETVYHFLPIVVHFRLIQNWQKQHPCSIG